jgi:hypothetical protein
MEFFIPLSHDILWEKNNEQYFVINKFEWKNDEQLEDAIVSFFLFIKF